MDFSGVCMWKGGSRSSPRFACGEYNLDPNLSKMLTGCQLKGSPGLKYTDTGERSRSMEVIGGETPGHSQTKELWPHSHSRLVPLHHQKIKSPSLTSVCLPVCAKTQGDINPSVVMSQRALLPSPGRHRPGPSVQPSSKPNKASVTGFCRKL